MRWHTYSSRLTSYMYSSYATVWESTLQSLSLPHEFECRTLFLPIVDSHSPFRTGRAYTASPSAETSKTEIFAPYATPPLSVRVAVISSPRHGSPKLSQLNCGHNVSHVRRSSARNEASYAALKRFPMHPRVSLVAQVIVVARLFITAPVAVPAVCVPCPSSRSNPKALE